MKYRQLLAGILLTVGTGWLLSAQSAQGKQHVRVYTEQQDDYSIRFFADNNLFIPAFVYISFDSMVNLSPDVDIPFGTQIGPETGGQYLFTLRPGDGNRISYKFAYSYSMGNPLDMDPDEDFLYSFPYAHGTKHRITQGFSGKFTHMGDNQYALDFDLEIATPVYAARDGVVVEIKEDSNTGGPGVQYGPYANYIRIIHEDGTFGNYVHLQQNGALVQPRDRVRAGQHIGFSGNTGRSSGPHLHFDVGVPVIDGTMQSIPVLFTDDQGTIIEPAENVVYYAYHQGGEPFEAIYGRDMANADYEDYSERADAVETLDFRVEQVDLTYVVFIGNGFDYAVDAQVRMRLKGMVSTTGSPVSVQLEAGEERFFTILRLRPGATNPGWRFEFISVRPQ